MLSRLLAVVMLGSFLMTGLNPPALAQRTSSRGASSSGGVKTVHVSGYTRKDGTYVQPHMRSAPGTAVRTTTVQPYTHSTPSSAARTTARTEARVSPPVIGVVAAPPSARSVVVDPIEPDHIPQQNKTKHSEQKATTKPATLTPEAKAEQDEKAAAGALALYEELIEQGKTDGAKYRLQKLIERYPNTKAANEARRLLKKL